MPQNELARVVTACAQRGPCKERRELWIPIRYWRQTRADRRNSSIRETRRYQAQAEWRSDLSSRPVRPTEARRARVRASRAGIDILRSAEPSGGCGGKQIFKVRYGRDHGSVILAVRQRELRHQPRRCEVVHA